MKRFALFVVVVFTVYGPSAGANPEGRSGNDFFGVSDTFQSVGESHGDASGQPITAATHAAGDDVRISRRLACGDADGNLQIDTFVCESSLMRCGVGDRGLIFYATAHLRDGSTEAAGTGCYLPAGETFTDTEGVVPARPQLTPALVLRAFERVPLPESELVVQPPGGQTLVGLETIFSTDAEGFTETVTLLGRSVELDITPASYRWSHGDSTEQTTDWPGREWRRGGAGRYVVHTYEDRMRVATSVDTTWSARYRVDGDAWQEVPGTVTIEGQAASLRVRSASPHLVGVADRG